LPKFFSFKTIKQKPRRSHVTFYRNDDIDVVGCFCSQAHGKIQIE